MALKRVVFCLGYDVLSRFTQGIDFYTSVKIGAFNANVNNSALFCMLHAPFSFTNTAVSRKGIEAHQ